MTRSYLKYGAFILGSMIVLPLLLGVWLERVSGRKESFFRGSSQFLSLIPFRFGQILRAAFYKHVCTNVDREIIVGFLTLFSHSDTDIGKHVYIGAQSTIGSCSIGQDRFLVTAVHVLSGKHQHGTADSSLPMRLQGGIFEKIKIGENCWVGNQATIMANVGNNTIVAAGANIVDAMAADSVVAGNTARVLRSR